MQNKIYDQSVDSHIKRYKEIRNLAIGQSEDYMTGCFLDYEYIRNHYRLIVVDKKIRFWLERNSVKGICWTIKKY